VIDWIGSVFKRPPDKEMRGLEWGRLYESYHSNSYDPAQLDADVERLLSDPSVQNRKGIYEYLLGQKSEPQLLSIRFFDDKTKAVAYQQQTQKAQANVVSNCPLCAVGDNSNRQRIYTRDEMDADHVTAWSKQGPTELANCEMLCATHNRAKGNR